jgi:hypothetical protein
MKRFLLTDWVTLTSPRALAQAGVVSEPELLDLDAFAEATFYIDATKAPCRRRGRGAARGRTAQ